MPRCSAFLRTAQADGARFVLVITGKGARTRDDWSDRGVLKRQVPQWLRLAGIPQLRRRIRGCPISAMAARARFYVRLRRARGG